MTQETPPPAVNIQIIPRAHPPERESRIRFMETSPRRLTRSARSLDRCFSDDTELIPSAVPRHLSPSNAVDCSQTKRSLYAAMPGFQSCPLIQAIVSCHWTISTCKFMVRAGPLVQALRADVNGRFPPKRYQYKGLGFNLSVYLPQCLRSIFRPAILNLQILMTVQERNSLSFSLEFPRAVAVDAEIFNSVRAGRIEDVKRLLSLRKASAKDITIFGTSLLHSASKSGSTELVHLLIREGADVNAQDEDGDSPLHGAMTSRANYDIARILIDHGADISLKAVDGRTPLHNIFNDTISHVLMRDDWIESMLPDSEGMSITHYLAWSSRSTPEVFQRGRLYDSTKMLSADHLGRTCIHLAAARGNVGILSYLAKKVSLEDLERKDISGREPLHYAVGSSRSAAIVSILVENGCIVDALDTLGHPITDWAARRCDIPAAKKVTAISDETSLPWPNTKGPRLSQEVCQLTAPAHHAYSSRLEYLQGLTSSQANINRCQRRFSARDCVPKLSNVMQALGLLSIFCFILFGNPG